MVRAYAADMKAAGMALDEGNRGQTKSLLDRYVPRAGEPDIRGFEWHLLHSRSAGDELISFDHTGINAGVVLGPKGDWIAAVAKYGPLRIWDVQSGKLLHEFPSLSRGEARRSLALSTDGQHIVHLGDAGFWLRRTRDWSVVWEFPAKANVIAFTHLPFRHCRTWVVSRAHPLPVHLRPTLVSWHPDAMTAMSATMATAVERRVRIERRRS